MPLTYGIYLFLSIAAYACVRSFVVAVPPRGRKLGSDR